MNTGSRLYLCDDCGEKRMVHWIELNRAAKPRCNKCGCTRMEIVSTEGAKEIASRQSFRVTGGNKTAALVSREKNNPRHRVT